MEPVSPKCTSCEVRRCFNPNKETTLPAFCPTRNYPDVTKETLGKHLNDPYVKRINESWSELAKRTAVNRYAWTRVEEVMEFAKIRGNKKLGIATCAGLLWESKLLAKILEEHGFEVVSVSCLTGEISSTEAGLEREGVFCNPLMQAEVLNREDTDLNIVMGLCVGHDILFNRYSKSDVTTLVVKDRSTCHNPVAAIYQSAGYFTGRLKPKNQ